MLGFDAVAPVELPGFELTLIKGTHTKRHIAAVKHLLRYMEDENEEIMRVYYKTGFQKGKQCSIKQNIFMGEKYLMTGI